jgi:hypothetical protein
MPTGLLCVYDADDSHTRAIGSARDADYKLAVSGGIKGLTEAWKALTAQNMQFSRVVFDTHGNVGQILFTHEAVHWGNWASIFDVASAAKMFPYYTRVYFSGCNIAEDSEGWLFLQEVGKGFCRGAAGVTFAWTSKGYVLCTSWPTDHWIHGSGDVKYVVFSPGGRVWDMFTSVEVVSAMRNVRAMLGDNKTVLERWRIMEGN